MAAILIALCLVLIGTLGMGFLFVSIVWTHRPDLSVIDILRESMVEIKNDMKAGKNRQKGKAYEQNYHL